jgi:hypothetical protein
MYWKKKTNRVVVVIEGGVVQAVSSDKKIEFLLIDWDNIKEGGERVVTVPSATGRECVDVMIEGSET